MRVLLLAACAASFVTLSNSGARAQVDPVSVILSAFGVGIPDYVVRYEVSGVAKPRGNRCLAMLSGGKTYSLALRSWFVPEIPQNTKIRVTGYGVKHGPGLRCPGTIGMVVTSWWPES
jgi:hypothetical protein